MLNEKVKNCLQAMPLWTLATTGNTPNIVIIKFHEIDDQENLVFYQVFMNTSVENIKTNPHVAVLASNPENPMEAYQVNGTATYSDDAAIVAKGNALASAMGLTAKGAIIVKPGEVIVRTPGPNAGKPLN